MRTTLSLDDDVAAMIEHVRQERKLGLKSIVNEALRRGLNQMTARPAQRKPYRTRAASLGRCHIGSLDNVAEALAVAERESFR